MPNDQIDPEKQLEKNFELTGPRQDWVCASCQKKSTKVVLDDNGNMCCVRCGQALAVQSYWRGIDGKKKKKPKHKKLVPPPGKHTYVPGGGLVDAKNKHLQAIEYEPITLPSGEVIQVVKNEEPMTSPRKRTIPKVKANKSLIRGLFKLKAPGSRFEAERLGIESYVTTIVSNLGIDKANKKKAIVTACGYVLIVMIAITLACIFYMLLFFVIK